MPGTNGSVDIRTTEEFINAQGEDKFRSWLKYQEASFALDEGFDKAQDLPYLSFDEKGIESAEQTALSIWNTPQQAFDDDNIHLAMHFAYFVGEVFVRSFQGKWVNLPRPQNGEGSRRADVDLPFRESFPDPIGLFRVALHRRTGKEWARVFNFAQEDYDKWVAAGRPERVLD